jgi:hypothetical protein
MDGVIVLFMAPRQGCEFLQVCVERFDGRAVHFGFAEQKCEILYK